MSWTTISIKSELLFKLKELKKALGIKSVNKTIIHLIEVLEEYKKLKLNQRREEI